MTLAGAGAGDQAVAPADGRGGGRANAPDVAAVSGGQRATTVAGELSHQAAAVAGGGGPPPDLAAVAVSGRAHGVVAAVEGGRPTWFGLLCRSPPSPQVVLPPTAS